VSGHSLKQVKHNSLDCHNFLEYFPLIVKFNAQNLTQIKNVFTC
jgi:hypothetical protein